MRGTNPAAAPSAGSAGWETERAAAPSAGSAGWETEGADRNAGAGDRDAEAELAAAVVETLLREDYAGLSRHVRVAGDEAVLGLPGGLVLPLRPDGFLADFAVA